MLPGEEWRVERLFRATHEFVSKLLSNSANTGRRLQSNLMPPAGDGSVAWANPQVVSAVLLGAITLLLFVRFGGPSKVSPRRIVRIVRRLRRRAPGRHVGRQPLARGLQRVRIAVDADEMAAVRRERLGDERLRRRAPESAAAARAPSFGCSDSMEHCGPELYQIVSQKYVPSDRETCACG